MNSNDYLASTTNYPSCAYSSIEPYNSTGWQGPPSCAPIQSGYYIVPDINPVLSYDTLVKGASCNGYASIVSAYGVGAENCCPGYKKMCCANPIPCAPCAPVMAAPCQPFQVQAAKCVDTAQGPVIMGSQSVVHM